jgi:uridine phosphorylase
MSDDPILTPRRVLSLRGVDPAAIRFDLAVLCFRGPTASGMMVEATGAREVKGPLLYGSRCFQGAIGGLSVAVLPLVVFGGPVTAILLEELVSLGVRAAIGFGAAGSLVTEAHISQMFIAEQAAGFDGTSREYAGEHAGDAWASADQGLMALARRLSAQEGISPLQGSVWTTDALYRERPSRVRRWREQGADLVNLECGPFYTVAASLGIRAIYLGLVTDYVSKEQGWRDGVWGRENVTDPAIARIVCGLIDAIAAKGR